jgi:hypothetical protein
MSGQGERSRLESLLHGYQWSQVLSTAVRLGIPEAVAAGELTAETMAAKRGLNTEAVRRLLQCLAGVGVLKQAGSAFEPGPGLEFLVPGTGQSLVDLALFGDAAYRAWANLGDTIVVGESGFELAFGEPLFKYFAAHPGMARAFNGSMSVLSRSVVERFVDVFDLGDTSEVVDVGGGVGHLGAALADAHEHLQVTVFDLPQVEGDASDYLRTHRRCRFESGSFFKTVPAGAGVYLLKWILHDWPDDRCERILSNCRAALAPRGRLIVIERILPDVIEAGSADDVLIMDLMMLALGGVGNAQERTLAQYDDLLARASLERRRVTPLVEGFAAIEATALP